MFQSLRLRISCLVLQQVRSIYILVVVPYDVLKNCADFLWDSRCFKTLKVVSISTSPAQQVLQVEMSTEKANGQEAAPEQSLRGNAPQAGKGSFFQRSGRLFSSLPTKQFLGNLSTSANSLSQTLQQRATELPSSLSSIQAKLQQGATQLPSSLSSIQAQVQQRATGLPSSLSSIQAKLQHLPADIAHMPRDFESARNQFVSSKPSAEKQARKGSENLAAWVGFGEYEPILKQKILNLSLDKRNFLVDPPENTTYKFDMAVYSPVATATLKEDPNLANMRFLLVPKMVQEPKFWHNYFYRVMLIKQSVFDGDDTQSDQVFESAEDVEEKKDDVLFDFNDGEAADTKVEAKTDTQDSPVKNADTTSSDSQAQTTKAPAKPKGNEDMEDWEREMREAAGLF
ncbi:hypothetical protein INT43_000349 [Umbelopsis isabellina]|uniref:BSD domain-containing protein n=1 Tax=Mortierella isabellina TaxID=91625 RepID=A0A8H7Q349_MORIS|nr:hypothetical protein INT43_000349 [Umbelopsis isabellina]